MSTEEHRKKAVRQIRIAVISVSTTRTLADDQSGIWIKKQAKKEGHEVMIHQVVKDDITDIRNLMTHVVEKIAPHAVIMTGGTGLSPKDVTIEAVEPFFDKTLTAFGPVFSQLSFEQIDAAAIGSRATAGIINTILVFCIPGSLNACKLACNELIFPEIGHLLKHMREN
ncbi:MAG: molybdenum cofactor synthesis domain-containing protein [Desulfotignum sp.]